MSDDESVQCWHTEPGTPCDWNVCRQPDRLAAGDPGTDPAGTPPLGPKLRESAELDSWKLTRTATRALYRLNDRPDSGESKYYSSGWSDAVDAVATQAEVVVEDMLRGVSDLIRAMAAEHPGNAAWVEDCETIADRIRSAAEPGRELAEEPGLYWLVQEHDSGGWQDRYSVNKLDEGERALALYRAQHPGVPFRLVEEFSLRTLVDGPDDD